MTIIVNGQSMELTAIDARTGAEWTADLLGNYNALHQDDNGGYIMSEAEYAWWSKIIPQLNEISALEQELTAEQGDYYYDYFANYGDLEAETAARLSWLRENVK